jgi:hypothetical protein
VVEFSWRGRSDWIGGPSEFVEPVLRDVALRSQGTKQTVEVHW